MMYDGVGLGLFGVGYWLVDVFFYYRFFNGVCFFCCYDLFSKVVRCIFKLFIVR